MWSLLIYSGHFWQFVRTSKSASLSDVFSCSWNWNLVVLFGHHLTCFLGEISSPAFQPCSSGPLKTGFWELALSVQLQNGQWPSLQHVLPGTQRHKEETTTFFQLLLQCSEVPGSWCWLLREAVRQRPQSLVSWPRVSRWDSQKA